MTQPVYLGLDLETTGLDPTRDRILEVGVVVLDDDLHEIDDFDFSWVVESPPEIVDALMCDVVRERHERSGLLAELSRYGTRLTEVEALLLDLVRGFPERPILAGSSVHFDRAFLLHWMPALEAKLSHRHLDATPLRLLGGESWAAAESEHRALPDVRRSIERLRRARAVLRGER